MFVYWYFLTYWRGDSASFLQSFLVFGRFSSDRTPLGTRYSGPVFRVIFKHLFQSAHRFGTRLGDVWDRMDLSSFYYKIMDDKYKTGVKLWLVVWHQIVFEESES